MHVYCGCKKQIPRYIDPLKNYLIGCFMKKIHGLSAVLVLCVAVISLGAQDVEAKRFGGGSSFGSRPSHSSAFSGSSATSAPARSASQQQATAQNQMSRQGFSQRGGLMGMLGGLAIGGLLGSLFFGGAFESFNFMDIVVLVMGFLLLKTLFSRFRAAQPQPQTYQRNADYSNSPEMSSSSAGFNTDILFKKTAPTNIHHNIDPINLPAGFDSQHFLAGAKMAYTTLQTAWDAKDLYEIRGLTTDKVFAEIQTQLKATNISNHTEILAVDAQILEVRELGSELLVAVLFEAQMREEVNGPTEQVKEVWHFVKPKSGVQTKWLLDGIQQWAE